MSSELLSVVGAAFGLLGTGIGAVLAAITARAQRREHRTSGKVEVRLGKDSVLIDTSSMSTEEIRALLSRLNEQIESDSDDGSEG